MSLFHLRMPPTKNSIIGLLLFLSCTLVPASLLATEPASLYQAKKSLIQYHDSGQYDKDIATIINRAMLYLKARIAQPLSHSKKLAIVLDIDETSLSNYPSMLKLGFGGSEEDIKKAEIAAIDPVISPTLKLYQYAKANQIAVFFVTGRPENERDITILNLKKVGYQDWNGLILKPTDYKLKSIVQFKTLERKKIIDQGYQIVLNIGDQLSDLSGKYAEKSFKLPNPFYYLS